MKEKHSVAFNFVMNFILTTSSLVVPLITFPYVSRVLLPVGNGKVASATAIVSYLSMICMLGIPTYGIRVCAQVRDDKEKLSRTVQEILIINVVMMAAVYLAFGASLYLIPQFAEDRTLLVIMSSAILLNVIGVNWLYSALEEYAYITVVSLAFKVASVVLMFLFVRSQEDYLIYGGITILSNVGSYVLNFFRLGRYITLRPMGNYNLRRHLKPIGVFCAMTVATSIYTNLDVVMLKFISGDEQVGYYNVGVKVKTIVAGLVTSLGAVLLPRLSYYIEKGRQEEFMRMVSKALGGVCIMSLPLTVYFMMFARESIELLSGMAYEPAIVPMCIIMPTIVFIGVSNLLGMQVLVPTNREQDVLKSVIVGSIVDLVLNLALIPKYGASGASVGTLAAEFAVLFVQMLFLRKFLAKIKSDFHIVYYILALLPAVGGSGWMRRIVASVLAAGVSLMWRHFMVLAVTGVVFFGVYGGMLLVMGEPIVKEYAMPYLRKVMRRGI